MEQARINGGLGDEDRLQLHPGGSCRASLRMRHLSKDLKESGDRTVQIAGSRAFWTAGEQIRALQTAACLEWSEL